jgi:uncharacterized protein YcbX
MRVAALYRYPVKGFNPEECETLMVLPGGRIAGDRVLGVRFADAAPADDAWGTKHEFVALVNTPGLASLKLHFNHETSRLQIKLHGETLIHETMVDEPLNRRDHIASIIQDYVLGLAINPLSSNPGRLPVRLVGDGVTPRYQDSKAGFVTLHSRESLAAVSAAADSPDINESRFRSNIAIEGASPWEEQTWLGKRLRIGKVVFEAARTKTRCLATHANPASGKRDLAIMQALTKAFPSEKPTFAIAMTSSEGGSIHLGDKVMIDG